MRLSDPDSPKRKPKPGRRRSPSGAGTGKVLGVICLHNLPPGIVLATHYTSAPIGPLNCFPAPTIGHKTVHETCPNGSISSAVNVCDPSPARRGQDRAPRLAFTSFDSTESLLHSKLIRMSASDTFLSRFLHSVWSCRSLRLTKSSEWRRVPGLSIRNELTGCHGSNLAENIAEQNFLMSSETAPARVANNLKPIFWRSSGKGNWNGSTRLKSNAVRPQSLLGITERFQLASARWEDPDDYVS